jgi:hypothetical protein
MAEAVHSANRWRNNLDHTVAPDAAKTRALTCTGHIAVTSTDPARNRLVVWIKYIFTLKRPSAT